jgi:hypothetical protein
MSIIHILFRITRSIRRVKQGNEFMKIMQSTLTLKWLACSALALGLSACDSGGVSDTPTAKPLAPSPSLSIEAIKSYSFSWSLVADTTHYKLLENADGMSGFTQVGDNINSSTTTYEHIVPLYNRLNAQYILQACNNGGCTDSSTLSASPTASQLKAAIGYVKASNTGDNYANFGAALSISGDGSTLAIGATGDKSNATGINGDQSDSSIAYAGAVYVFTRSGANWSQQAYIKASGVEVRDRFGASVSLSEDGSTLAVGATEDSQPTNNGEGDVYIFTRSGTTWTEEEVIQPDIPTLDELFGYVVSLSDDGATLAVGGYKNKAYVFTRESTGWEQQAKLTEGDFSDLFGATLSLSGDGSTLAVGAAHEDSNGIGGINNSGINSGAVYVFTADAAGAWTQQKFLQASNVSDNDNFGNAVSLSQDGSILAVGSEFEDGATVTDNANSDAGAVYIFTRTGTAWAQQAYVKASNVEAGDVFGTSVSLSRDGSTLAVGAVSEDSETAGLNTDSTAGNDNEQGDAGAVYVFTRSNTTWSQIAYVKATNPDNGSYFGEAVSLNSDGSAMAVGFPRESSNATGIGGGQTDSSINRAGAVYLY